MIVFKDSIARPASAAPRYLPPPSPVPTAEIRPVTPPAPASPPTPAPAPAAAEPRAAAERCAASPRRGKAKLLDFGAKIGGARKDLSQPRAGEGEWGAIERIQSAWPPIDCGALIALGHSPFLVRLLAELRANALASPEKFAGTEQRIAHRVLAVEMLAQRAGPMLLALPPELVTDQEQLTRAIAHGMAPVWKELATTLKVDVGGRPHVSRAAIFSAVNQPWPFFYNRFHRLHAEVERGWPAPCRQWAVRFAAQDWRNNAGQGRDGVWFVRTRAERWTFSTEEAAREKAAEIFPQLAFVEPKEFVRLAVVRRDGLPSYRDGAATTPENFIATFGIRGVEWGNWIPQMERTEHLARAADALMDLSVAVGIRPADVSLGGRLALSFGARGKSAAAAHYEPGKRVINLTRHAGTGALAHEWFHALDHFLFEEYQLGELGWEGAKPFLSDARPRGLSGPAPRPSGFAGIAAWGSQRGLGECVGRLHSFLRGTQPTEFRRAAVTIDGLKGGSPYWQLPWELGARSFSAFVEDRLQAAGGFNEYLVHSTAKEAAEFCGFAIYPRGAERQELNATWSGLLDFLRRTPTPRAGRPAVLSPKAPISLPDAPAEDDGGCIVIGRPRGAVDVRNSP